MKSEMNGKHLDKEYFRKAKSLAERTKELAQYMLVHNMENRDAVPEDAHQCNFCTDLAYSSMVHCEYCQINYCTSH